MDKVLPDLIERIHLRPMLDSACETMGVSGTIADVNGQILLQVRWQDVCSKFHLKRDECALCLSDCDEQYEVADDATLCEVRRCQSGLLVAAAPIYLSDQPIGRVLLGQFLSSAPDIQAFKEQAVVNGYEVEPYIEAVYKVPVLEPERIKLVTNFVGTFSRMLSKLCADRSAHHRSDARQAASEAKYSDLEDSLAKSEERFRSTFEQAAVGIAHISPDGRWLRINARCCEILGYTRNELEQLTFQDVTYPDDLGADLDHVRRLEEGLEDHYSMEKRYIRKDGSVVWANLTVSVVRKEGGAVQYYISVIEDISSRRFSEEAVRKTNAELAGRNAELEQFVYTVSHDLKSPLVTIQGYATHIQRDLNMGRLDRLTLFLPRITRATERMSNLIEDLLQLSRVGRVNNDPEVIDIAFLCKELFGTLSGLLVSKKIDLQIDKSMPEAFGDRVRIMQVFENLITNAIKYGCPQSNMKIEIGGFVDDSESTIFFVRDHGPGIPEEHQQRIFGLFQRLEKRGEGTGVGLAIVKRIVEHHHGRVWVESESQKGSTFFVRLPNRHKQMSMTQQEQRV